MSGGFTFGQGSTGFSFGTQKTTATATGSTFGMTSSTPAAPGGGFSFGTGTPGAPNSFGFGTPAKSTVSGGGFSFGTPAATSLGLGTAPQATPSGLTFGSPATPAGGTGFALAAAAAPAAAFTAAPAAAAAAAALTAAAATTGTGSSFTGFPFGPPKVQATTPAAPPASSGGGFSFGTSAPSNLTLGSQTQPTSIAASVPGQGGGFAFGIKPSSTPAPPVSTQTATISGSSLFTTPITTAMAAATTTASTGFPLGVAATLAPGTSTATTTAAAGGLAFTLKPLGAATPTAASATTTAAAATVPPTGFTLGLKPAPSTSATATAIASSLTTTAAPPVMTYAQLEALINKWSLELEDQERHFLQQATQVNAWDRMLVENGEKITSLHKEMEKVKLDQRRLNQELDFILSQQKELEDLLCPLEESVKEQSGTIYMQNADEERERTYKLAENVDAQLKRMSQDLKEIIEHLNTSSGPADSSDPLQQICKILNTHMDSLQWIDQNSVLLQRRVEEVSKLCDNQRKEQEKTFRLTFD
uniref:Nuclear pore glycoprotein p62 n=1 Tax=Takifugu rubripes TaxID=31033 RepID=H2V866_TAKRU